MKQDIEKLVSEMDDFFYGIMEIDSLSGLASKNEQPQLDEISKKYACAEIGSSWREVPYEIGFNLIKDGIAFDLVFTNHRNVDDETAIECTKRYLSHFSSSCRFFTNVSDSPWRSGSYGTTPLTEWTFDCGVIVKDKKNIGFICFMGED